MCCTLLRGSAGSICSVKLGRHGSKGIRQATFNQLQGTNKHNSDQRGNQTVLHALVKSHGHILLNLSSFNPRGLDERPDTWIENTTGFEKYYHERFWYQRENLDNTA